MSTLLRSRLARFARPAALAIVALVAIAHANPIVDPRIGELDRLAAKMLTDESLELDARFTADLVAIGHHWLKPETCARMEQRPDRFMACVLAAQRARHDVEWGAQSFCRVHGDSAVRAAMLGWLRARIGPDTAPDVAADAAEALADWGDTASLPGIVRLAEAARGSIAGSSATEAAARLRRAGAGTDPFTLDGRGGIGLLPGDAVLGGSWLGNKASDATRPLTTAECERLRGALRAARECALEGRAWPGPALLTVNRPGAGALVLARQRTRGYAVLREAESRFAIEGARLDEVLRRIAADRGDTLTFAK